MENIDSNISSEEELVGIDEVQKFLNRSRASVYRYTNTDLRNLNPNFNPRKLNPEFRTDQKEPLKFMKPCDQLRKPWKTLKQARKPASEWEPLQSRQSRTTANICERERTSAKTSETM